MAVKERVPRIIRREINFDDRIGNGDHRTQSRILQKGDREDEAPKH